MVLVSIAKARLIVALIVALGLATGIAACADTCVASTTPESQLDQARALQARARWAASESLAVAALAGFEQRAAPDSTAIADALLRIGTARWKLSAYADGVGLASARRALGIRARTLGIDDPEVATAHLLLGHILVASDQADAAMAHAEQALRIRRAQLQSDDPALAAAWSLLGTVHRVRDEFPAAREAYASALATLERAATPQTVEIALVLGHDAVCLMRQGEIVAARIQLERADALLIAAIGPDAAQRQDILSELAQLERATGDLAAAIDRTRESIRLMRATGSEDLATLANRRANLGLLLMYFGDWAGARAAYLDALPVFVAHYGSDHENTANLKSRIGIALGGLGHHEQSLHWLRESEAVYAARPGPPDTGLAISLRWQAEQHNILGEHARARELCERAIAIARQARRPWGEAVIAPHYLLISVLERSGDLAALERFAQALPQVAEEFGMHSPVTRTNVNYWSARAERRLGRTDTAWTLALAAEQISRERIELQARTLPDRRALELSDRQARNLDLVLEIALNDGQRVEQAWDRLVRSRGVVRAEMSRRRLPRSLLADPQVAAAQSRWVDAQADLARARIKTLGAEPDTAARAKLDQLDDAAEEAERTMRTLLAGRFEPGSALEVGLAEVLAHCGAGRALVSMVELDAGTDSARVISFVRGAGGARAASLELGSTLSLREVIEPWRAALAASPAPSARDAAHAEAYGRQLGERVRRQVWDPLVPHLAAATEVMIVADGPMIDLPWHALPDGEHHYLVETGPLVVLLEAEREVLGNDQLPRASSLLAVGAPDYDRGPDDPVDHETSELLLTVELRTAPDPCAGQAPLGFAPLPETAIEATTAAAVWIDRAEHRRSRVMLGAEADEGSVRRASADATVLHLATHGFVTPDTCTTIEAGALRGVGGVSPLVTARRSPSPWSARRVWLALAGANHAMLADHADRDGLLTAEEVVTLDLHETRWVVLSACHSGWAETFTREGSSGLRRAFRLAGAGTVISSHWALDDTAAREWMAAFYDAAATLGQGASSAFATACRAKLDERRATGQTTHPFYWAGFTAVGR